MKYDVFIPGSEEIWSTAEADRFDRTAVKSMQFYHEFPCKQHLDTRTKELKSQDCFGQDEQQYV